MRNMIAFILIAALLAALLLGCAQTGSDPTETNTDILLDPQATSEATVSATSEYPLSNPNADATTQRVYEYLCQLSGNGVLSGQQESTWMGSPDYEMDYIYEQTGKYPAIRGLDYMHDDFDGVNARAIEWWEKGGLVTICWHTGCDFVGEWSDATADEIDDWDAVLTEGTEEYEAFVAGMDKAAQALLQLQEAGVTVIWRPFHEFDGMWFWWGKGGTQSFIALWQLMYTRYTEYWGLNNLIWVLPYSGNGTAYKYWYPGDEYCDVLGADSYDGGVQTRLYEKLTELNSTKPCCFHECGTNPTAEEFQTTPWIWFMTWHTEHITDYNTPEDLSALYNSDYVITLDELPSFTD